mgnify:FL=1
MSQNFRSYASLNLRNFCYCGNRTKVRLTKPDEIWARFGIDTIVANATVPCRPPPRTQAAKRKD